MYPGPEMYPLVFQVNYGDPYVCVCAAPGCSSVTLARVRCCSTAQKVPKEPPFGVFRSKQGSVSLLGPAEDLHTQNRRDWHRPSAQMGAKVKHDRGTRLTTVFSTFFTKY